MSRRGLYILHDASAGDAFHDSAERYPPPRCHPETRKQILDDLWEWSSSSDPSRSVLWLYGPAGAGKSAIAQSFCQNLERDGRLWGSFFFKRGDTSRGNAKRLFSTLAYQLALVENTTHSDSTSVIARRVEENPSILDRSLSVQLQALIIEPYRRCAGGVNLVIVIDGLDECAVQAVQQEILRAIGKCLHGHTLHLRFFIASRPEPHIREILRSPCLERVHQPLNIRQSFDDVEKYFVDEFTRIHAEHHETMATVPTPWPSSNVIFNLVQKSSGYFIYASTVISFIDDKNFRPTDRLEVILGLAKPELGSPFAALDELYIQILSNVPARPHFLEILAVIAAGFFLEVDHIEQLLGMKPGDLRLTLRGLHSVIKVPDLDSECHNPLTVHHASLGDFLRDPARSQLFYVSSESEDRTDLARHILKAFSYMHDDPALNRRRGPVAW